MPDFKIEFVKVEDHPDKRDAYKSGVNPTDYYFLFENEEFLFLKVFFIPPNSPNNETPPGISIWGEFNNKWVDFYYALERNFSLDEAQAIVSQITLDDIRDKTRMERLGFKSHF